MQTRIYRKFLAATLLAGCSVTAFAQEAVEPAPNANSSPVSTTAATANRALNDLFVPQWVQGRASGELVGRVVHIQADAVLPAEGMQVVLSQNGKIVSETKTTANGAFTMEAVPAGRYTLVSRGANSIGMFSLVVLDPQSGHHLPAEVEVPLANVDSSLVDKSLAATIHPDAVSASTVVNADPLGDARNTSARDYCVSLTSDNGLEGQLSASGIAPTHTDIAGTNVSLIKDGREVARTQADVNGKFSFKSVQPGTYGLFASGRAGVAAVGFCAKANALSSATTFASEKFVSVEEIPADSLNVELGEIVVVETEEDDEDEAFIVLDQGFAPMPGPPGMMGGGFGGPGGFGGGMGGGGMGGGGLAGLGGGRFGSLAMLGALGGVAAAIASNDNGTVVTASGLSVPVAE